MSTNGPITRSDTTSMVSTRPRANRVCVDPGSKFESTNPSSGAIVDVCIEHSLQRYKALEKPGALELSQLSFERMHLTIMRRPSERRSRPTAAVLPAANLNYGIDFYS